MLLSPTTVTLSLPGQQSQHVQSSAVCQNPNWRVWNTPGDKTTGSGPPCCQSQIGHFANWQLTNWAADSDPFEIEGVLGESWWSREGGGGLHRGVSQTESLHNHRLWGSFLGKCVHHRHRQTQGGFYSEAHLKYSKIPGSQILPFCSLVNLPVGVGGPRAATGIIADQSNKCIDQGNRIRGSPPRLLLHFLLNSQLKDKL